jgi:hypothetical protein
LRDDMIGDCVAFGYRQTLPKPAHDFDRAAQSESNPVSQYVPAGHRPVLA